MSNPCRACGADDRTPSGKCRPCQQRYNAAHRAKASKARETKKASTISEAVPALKIDAGYGLVAILDDGYLKVEQRDQEGNSDTLMISRAELKQIMDAFGEWARG